jgi:hypothetical protein
MLNQINFEEAEKQKYLRTLKKNISSQGRDPSSNH